MKRYVQISGLVVLALAASGWWSVIAAAFCPHANLGMAKAGAAGATAEEQACHSAKPEIVAKPDCHDTSMGQEAVPDMESSHAMPGNEGNSAALVALPDNVPCTHCMGRPEPPVSTAIARQSDEQKRSLEPATAQASSSLTPLLSFTPPVIYRQGAPPGSSTPKHLLISVLLI